MTSQAAAEALLAIPLIASPVVYLAGRLSHRRGDGAAPARWLALAAIAASTIPAVFIGRDVLSEGPVTLAIGRIALSIDAISVLLALTVLALTFLAALFSVQYVAGEPGEEKYYALLTAMAGAMIGLGCAGDLFNLWVWFEAMAITSYMLVAFYRDQHGALEAGVKYLVQSAIGSALVLFAIAIVLGATGSLNFQQIRAAGMPPALMMLAGALFVVGFGVKAALVPLHTWLPDAHSQAPSGISAMLSGVVIEAGLIALLRSLVCLAPAGAKWGPILLAFGAAGMLVGNLMALRQTHVKRLLAYSSVSHVGYMLVGFGVTAGFGVINGAAGAFFHLINHALMKGLAFLAAGALLYSLHLAKEDREAPLTIDDLDGASSRYPFTAFAFSVALLALGGLPPLSGFMSKWQIFVAGFETHAAGVEWLVIFAAFNSVLSLAYYAPLVNRMYRRAPSAAVEAGTRVSATMALPIGVMTVAVIVIGLWPRLADGVTVPAARALASMFGGAPMLARF